MAGSRHHTWHHTCTCFSNQLQNINLYLFLLHLPFFITFITPLEHRRAPPHFLLTSLTYRNFYFINHSVCLLDTTMLLIQILSNNSNFFMRISFSASIFVLIIQYILWIRLWFWLKFEFATQNHDGRRGQEEEATKKDSVDCCFPFDHSSYIGWPWFFILST